MSDIIYTNHSFHFHPSNVLLKMLTGGNSLHWDLLRVCNCLNYSNYKHCTDAGLSTNLFAYVVPDRIASDLLIFSRVLIF